MNVRNCLFSDIGKLGVRWDHQRHQIKMKLCTVGGLQEIVLRFKFHQNRSSGFTALSSRNLPFLTDLAIGLYKSVISQQIKEVIGNEHEKLNKLMIAQTP